MFPVHFSFFGSPHQRIWHDHPPDHAAAPKTEASTSVPAATKPSSGDTFQARAKDVFHAPTGFWTALAWPVTTAWKTLWFGATELVGAGASLVQSKKIGGTMTSTREAIFGNPEKHKTGIIPGVATRASEYLKRGIIDTSIAPVARTTRNLCYSLLQWTGSMSKAAWDIGKGIGKQAVSLPMSVVGAPLSLLGAGGLAKRAKGLRTNGRNSIIDGYSSVIATGETIGDIGRTIKYNALDAVRGLVTSPVAAFSPHRAAKIDGQFREMAHAPTFLDAFRASRKQMTEWMRGTFLPPALRPSGGGAEAPASAH